MIQKVFRWVDQILGFVEDWSLFLTVSLALVVAMVNVVLRKVTPISLYWSDEVVKKTIFFSTYIGCSAAVRSRALIRIDALPQMVPVLKKPLTLISHLAVILFALLMIRYGWTMTAAAYADPYARSATLAIPEWYFYAVLVVMGGMLVMRTIMVMVEDWRGAPVK
jgi:C4-dicarboxylate transporter, DctQ subunit